jgi:hypothetical protein
MAAIPDKVTIELTPKDYTVIVWRGTEVLSKRKDVMVSRGESRAEAKGDVYDDLPHFQELAEQVDGLSLDLFAVSSELYDLAHGDSPDSPDETEEGV